MFRKLLKIFMTLTIFACPMSSLAQTVDTCLSANVDRYLWVTDTLAFAEGKDLKTRLELAEKVFAVKKEPLKTFSGPWEKGLVSTYVAQKEALADAIEAIHSAKLKTAADVKSFLRGKISSGGSGYLNKIRAYAKGFDPTGQSEETKKILKSRPVTRFLDEVQDKSFITEIQNAAGIVATCAKMSIADSVPCSQAVSLIYRESRWSGANILFPRIWLESFQSKKFREGLSYLALKQLDRIENKDAGNFLTDAVQAFMQAGATPAVAEELVWKTLALYGNGGHNTGVRALLYDLTEQDMITAVSLSIIGTAVTVLDFDQRLGGKPHYALPPTTIGSCLSPKPYHFWMNAYISRYLIRAGFSPSIAAMASFTVSKAYHLNRQKNNAGSEVIKIFTKPADHPTNRVIKMDLTLNAAGALYGAGTLRRELNFSAAMQSLMDKTQSYRGITANEASEINANKIKVFNLWHEVFQPDFIFDYFRN